MFSKSNFMRKLFLIEMFIVFTAQTFGQNDEVLFSEVVKKNFRYFKTQSIQAYRYGDFERGQFLFDSLVQNQLIGSKFNDFTLKKVSNKKLKIGKIKKPVFLVTYAAWCVPTKGEIPALNKLAKEFDKDIEFIVIIWGKKKEAQRFAKKFNSKIEVCYAHKNYRNDNEIVESMKLTLGFPTTYLLNERLQVIDIKRGSRNTPYQTPLKIATQENYAMFKEKLELLRKREQSLSSSVVNF